ncbi:MAG: translation initiation factor 2, partial [Rhodobacterales bacterium]|nr:translation initiation factor 2 [Rhodobacterales bacterium]
AAPAADALPPSGDPTTADPADASLVAAGDTAADPAAESGIAAPSDPAMAGFRPRPRPEGLTPATDDDAALPMDAETEFAGLRPLARPESVVAAASASRPAEPAAEADVADLGAQGASLAAQAEADLAAAAALEASNPSVVAISKRPESRPRDLSRAVEAAVAAAVRAPEPPAETAVPEAEVVAVAAAAPAPDLKPEELDEVNEPETSKAAPKIPTKASVAKQATFKNAINLSKVNLIGTYGTDSKRTALVRQSNGRYKKVKVGDRIDGGTVKAITATEVRYQKGGQLLTLKMPKA